MKKALYLGLYIFVHVEVFEGKVSSNHFLLASGHHITSQLTIFIHQFLFLCCPMCLIFIQIWNYGFVVDIHTSFFFQFQDATEGGPARLVRLILLVPARRGPLWVTAPMWLTNDRLKIPPPPLSSASPPPFFSRTKLGPKLYVSMHYHFLTQHNIR